MKRINIVTNLWDDEKSIALGEMLNDDDAWRYIIRLWAWGMDSDRADGTCHLGDWRLSTVCGYRGEPSEFVGYLVASGWLKRLDGGGYYMTGWLDMYQKYFEKRQRDTDRQRLRRENVAATSRLRSGDVAASVTVTDIKTYKKKSVTGESKNPPQKFAGWNEKFEAEFSAAWDEYLHVWKKNTRPPPGIDTGTGRKRRRAWLAARQDGNDTDTLHQSIRGHAKSTHHASGGYTDFCYAMRQENINRFVGLHCGTVIPDSAKAETWHQRAEREQNERDLDECAADPEVAAILAARKAKRDKARSTDLS